MKLRTLLLAFTLLSIAQSYAQNVGVGNTSPNSKLDVSGDLALREGTAITVSSGNNIITLPSAKNSVYRLTGATGAFTINAISAGNDGMTLTLINATGQVMTVRDSASIRTNINANLVGTTTVSSLTLIYNATIGKWIVTGSEGYNTSAANAWNTTGNTGTTAANFMGTTDNNPLYFKTNNTVAGFLPSSTTGNIYFGISTSIPTYAGENVGIGNTALSVNTTGFANVAIGQSALQWNSTGNTNTAIGYSSLEANTFGSNNVGVGIQSLLRNTTGSSNVALGFNAIQTDTSGSYNVGLGLSALNNLLNGSKNVAIGDSAGYNELGSNSVFIGPNAGYNETTGNKLYISNSNTSTPLIYGDFTNQHLTVNDSLTTQYIQMTSGATAGYVLQSDALGNAKWVNAQTAANAWGLTGNAGTTGSNFLGTTDANPIYFKTNNSAVGYLPATATGSIIFGVTSASTTANYNVLIGNNTGNSNLTGSYNIALGSSALRNNTSGTQNIAAGTSALSSNNTGSYNIALGLQSMTSMRSGLSNIAMGFNSLLNDTSGNYNVAISPGALNNLINASNNVAIGNNAAYSTLGSNTVAIGAGAGFSATGGSNVFLGYSAGFSETGSNKLYISNSNTANPLIYGDFTNQHLTVNDSLTSKYFEMTNGATAGYLLQSDASGNGKWVSPSSITTGTTNTLTNTTNTITSTVNGIAATAHAVNTNVLAISGDSITSTINGVASNKVSISASNWSLTGNAGTTASNFLGTTDNNPLYIKTNGAQVAYLPAVSSDNIYLGLNTGYSTGTQNIDIGNYSGGYSSGSNNIALGVGCLQNDVSGTENIAIGSQVMFLNSTGSYNVGIGNVALSFNTTGSSDLALGSGAAYSNKTGSSNVALGNSALNKDTAGNYNVAVGINSGYSTYGSGNVFLGYEAGYNEAGSNKLYISNSSTANPLIYGDFTNQHLTVNDSLTSTYFEMTNGAATNYLLQSDASGNGTWVNPSTIAAQNIYNTDGTLTGNRTMTMGADSITFSSTNGSFRYSTTNGNIEMGNTVSASGGNSLAAGFRTVASGSYSTALGFVNYALGNYSTTFGANDSAVGNTSFASGYGSNARSYLETSLGSCNTLYTPASTTAWNTADRLFGVGNGANPGSRSDAMVILKSGNVGIGYSNPTTTLQVNGKTSTTNFQMTNGGTANYLLVSDASGNGTWTNPATIAAENIYNTNGTLTGARTVTLAGNVLDFTGGNVSIGTPLANATFNVNGYAVIGEGLTPRSSIGLTVDYLNATAYAANTDPTDAARGLSISNEGTTANSMAILSMRSNAFGGANNQMFDMKLVNPNNGASNLIYSFGPNDVFTDRFTMTSAGSMGFGTTTPQGQLANTATNIIGSDGNGVNANSLVWAMSGLSGYVGAFYNAYTVGNAHGLAVKIAGTTSNNRILDLSTGAAQGTAGTEVMDVFGNGYVGIGTAAPTTTLDVNGGTLIRGTGNTNTPATPASVLELMSGRNSTSALASGQATADIALQFGGGGFRHFIASRHNSAAGVNTNAIDFYLNNSTTTTGSSAPGTGNVEVMSITEQGVGIGTNVPVNELQVEGNLHMDGNPIYFRQTATDHYDFIRWSTTGTGGASGDRLDMAGYAGVNLGYTSSGTGGSLVNVLTVTNGGEVGIGTTIPGYTLDVAGNGRFNNGGGTFVYVGPGGGGYYGDATNLVTQIPTGGSFFMANYGINGTSVAQATGSMRIGGPSQLTAALNIVSMTTSSDGPIYSDVNGNVLKNTGCPSGFTQIDVGLTRLCVEYSATSGTWNASESTCTSLSGSSICYYLQIQKACNLGYYFSNATNTWLADHNGDDNFISTNAVVNSGNCGNFDQSAGRGNSYPVFCCLEYMKF